MTRVGFCVQIVLGLVVFSGIVVAGRYVQPRVSEKDRAVDGVKFNRRGVAGRFLVETMDGETLGDRLKDSMKTITHPFGKIVMGADTLVTVGKPGAGKTISLGIAYRLDGAELTDSLDLGRLSVRMGRAPLPFELVEHSWSGSVMRSDFICWNSPLRAKFELTREVCVDHHGRAFMDLRLRGKNKRARELLKTKDFSYRLDGLVSEKTSWRVWYRQPDGALIRPGKAGRTVECGAVGERLKGLFVALVWTPNPISDASQVSAEDVELESRISKSHPIGSIKSAMKRWIGRTVPGWDSPEPWLNKLWAGQVFSICHQLWVDPETETLCLKYDHSDYLRSVLDVRWLHDASIGWRTLYAAAAGRPELPIDACSWLGPAGDAMLDCQPYPKLKKLIFRRMRATVVRLKNSSHCENLRIQRLLLANYRVLADWAGSNGKWYRSKAERLAGKFPSLNPAINNYAELIRWCRAFYPNNDCDLLTEIKLSKDGRRVEANVPVGVLDTVVTQIVGLKAGGTDRVRIAPAKWIGDWPYFSVDNLPYRGHNLTVVWQSPKHVKRYRNVELGFSIFVDGKLVKQTGGLSPVEVELK